MRLHVTVVTHVLQDLQDGLQDQGTMSLPSEYLGLMFQRNVSRFLGLFGSCLPSAWGRKSLRICFESFYLVCQSLSWRVCPKMRRNMKKQVYGNSGHVRLLARLALMRMQVKA